MAHSVERRFLIEELNVGDKARFIKEQVDKSGFPFEMQIASVLKGDKLEVLPSVPYWDGDEEKWRDIDIKAYKSILER